MDESKSGFQDYLEDLDGKIKLVYEKGVTLEDAEAKAAEFLHAQIMVSSELKNLDLDARMRKAGLKAIRAAIYLEAATKTDKRPTEATLAAMVDMHELVQGEQQAFDKAEVERDELERYYNIFQNAHIFYRGVAKGNFS